MKPGDEHMMVLWQGDPDQKAKPYYHVVWKFRTLDKKLHRDRIGTTPIYPEKFTLQEQEQNAVVSMYRSVESALITKGSQQFPSIQDQSKQVQFIIEHVEEGISEIDNIQKMKKIKEKVLKLDPKVQTPIYNHQHEKIIDLLHFVFHKKRIYP